MSWRTVVITNSAKLDYQMGYLTVRGDTVSKIHLNEIATVVIESTAVSLTAYLLSELVKNKIKVVFCDEKRNPSAELLAYYGSHDTSAKIRKQIKWADDVKRGIWTEIVSEKIRNQERLLHKLGKEEADVLRSYLQDLQYGDETNREGLAAKVYFGALFGKGFSRTDDSPINAALNYGYTLILSSFTRSVSANGYMTQIGLFHDNMFNPFNLASDLMEPFRPLVDKKVFDLRPEQFETTEKHEMIHLLQSELTIGGRTESLGNAVDIYARSIFDAINDEDISKIKFFQNEL